MTKEGGPRDEERPGIEQIVRYGWAAESIGGGRVLDAACGVGWGTSVLATVAEAAIGVDFSRPTVEEARRVHGDRGRFVEGNLQRLPFDAGHFDHVVCFEALAQVEDAEAVLEELCRVLCPDGLLFVSAPNPIVYPAGNPLQLSEIGLERLERALRARFANVAVHGEQLHFVSLLGDAELMLQDDPGITLYPRMRKSVGCALGDALHAVAVASNGELPPSPARLALAEVVDCEGQQRLLESWQERAIEAEAEAFVLKRQLRRLQR